MSNERNGGTARRTNTRSKDHHSWGTRALVDENVERPGRLTQKQVSAAVDLWRTGLSITEIEKLTGIGRATIHRYVKDIPRLSENDPIEGKNEIVGPVPPQVIDLQPVEKRLPQPPAAVPARVHVGMGIVVDFEVLAVLKGFASQEGFSDFNEYLRKRVVRWMGALKDFCPNEAPQEFFEKMTKVVNEAAEARRLEKQQNRWPSGRAYLIKNMEILGWTPEQIQREIAIIDGIERLARTSSS